MGEHTRLKNMAICKRKLPQNLSLQDLVKAINALDIKTLNMDTVELLQRMVPVDDEIKKYREYTCAGKNIAELSEEDQLMRQFSVIERMKVKLQIMSFMSTFDECLKMVKPQVDTVAVASKSLRHSKKMKKVLELILALGNYMNSNKKGPCYGFKLQSLDSLTITKTSDKKENLVHYLAKLVHEKFPELKEFASELKYLEKAVQISVENILTDVKELEKGMELTKRELGNRLNTPMNATTTNEQQRLKQEQNQILQNFVDRANDLVIKLKTDSSNAQTAFKECADYYGEDSKSAHCNTFFGYFVRF